MVTVVPGFNRGASLGDAIGQGFRAIEPMAQQQYQRNLLQNALSEAQTIFNDPNASQSDKLFAYKKAYAGLNNMGGDRAEASLIPHLLSASGGNQAVKNAPNLTPEENAMSAVQNLQKIRQNVNPQDRGIETPTRKGIDLPRHFSPEEIQNARRNDLKSGFVDAPTAKLMEAENADIDKEEARQNQAAIQHAEVAKERIGAEKQFMEFAKSRNPKLEDPFKENLFNEIANRPSVLNIDDQVKRFNAANDIFNRYESAENQLLKTLSRPSFVKASYDQKLNDAKINVKPLLDIGQRGLTEKLLSQLGWGRVEIAKITNDLPEKIKNEVKNLPDSKKYDKEKTAFEEVQEYYSDSKRKLEETRIEKYKEDFLNSWKNFLKKNIKSGEQDKKNSLIFKPGTDLLILRDDFMKKGGNYKDFNTLINNLVENDEIELDEYQLEQKNKLSNSPRQSMSLPEIFWNGIPGYIERQ